MATQAEEILKRIDTFKGVVGSIIINQDGIPVRTTMDNSITVLYTGLLKKLTFEAISAVRDIDPRDDVEFMRVKTKKHEIIVAPENGYIFVVIQNNQVSV